MARKDIIKWRENTDKGFLLPLIAKCRNVSGEKVGYTVDEDYSYWMPILKNSFTSKTLSKTELDYCVTKAFNDPSVNMRQEDCILNAANAAIVKLEQLPLQTFDIVFPITHKGDRLFNSLKAENIAINFLSGLKCGEGSRYLQARQELFQNKQKFNFTDEWENICFVRVRTSSRFIKDAFEIAETGLGTALGIANISKNSTTPPPHPMTFGIHPMHLINSFRMGQVFTIHNTDGSLNEQIWWFDNDWKNAKKWPSFNSPMPEVRNSIGKWWRRIHRNPHCNHISQALAGYTKALSNHDADETLLAMWRVLEQLTLTDGALTNHKQTVSRLKNMILHDSEASVVVNHLRHARNELVHRGKWLDGRDAAVVIHQHEWVLRAAIVFLIKNGGKFYNRDELERFLDLPHSNHEIEKLLELIKVRQSIE